MFLAHKNLILDTLKMQHVLCWSNMVEEFSPTLHYIEGPHNILADNLSRLHRLVTPAQITEGKRLVDPSGVSDDDYDFYFLDQAYTGFEDNDLCETFECYLNLPEIPHSVFNLLNYAHICEQQQQDETLLALQAKYPYSYVNMQLDDDVDNIICYKKDPTQDNWKIALPETMVLDTVKWFHQVMGHPGEKRLSELLKQ